MGQMALSDLFIGFPFTTCQALRQAQALTGLGRGACPGGTHSLGEGKWMDQQITYNQARSEFQTQEHGTQEMEQLTPNSGIQRLNAHLQRNKYLQNEMSYS